MGQKQGGTALTGGKILYFAEHTASVSSRSGVQRVVVNLAEALARIADVDFVGWDATANQLRYLSRQELERLFRSVNLPEGVRPSRFAGRIKYRFGDTLPTDRPVWLVQPEIFYHLKDGNELFARAMTQCREYGVQVASIFYDLIPITNADYASHRHEHSVYVNRLSQSDIMLPISHYVGGTLAEWYRSKVANGLLDAAQTIKRIQPLPLPDLDRASRPHMPAASTGEERTILCIGTVEPRKQQVQLVEAFKAVKDGPLAGYRLVIIGSLHPAVSAKFRSLVDDDPAIEYRGYVSDEEIDEYYRRAAFSVFPSNDEGFGLPICESVARGVPVLCANFGSMAEVAEGGGCHTVDVNDPEALRAGLVEITTQDGLLERLRQEIAARVFRTWNDYAHELLCLLEGESGFLLRDQDRSTLRMTISTLLGDGHASGGTDLTLAHGRVHILAGGTGSDRFETLDHNNSVAASCRVALIEGSILPEQWTTAAASALLGFDVVAGTDPDLNRQLINLANLCDQSLLLPDIVVTAASSEALADALAGRVAAFIARRHRLEQVRNRETTLMALGAASITSYQATRRKILSIVISTYNRYPFVRANVEWLLAQNQEHQNEVNLIVVDNVSTDDSYNKLRDEFTGRPVQIIRNASNVGMLGNLKVCTGVVDTPFIWMIGDDDFITEGAIGRIVETIKAEPELPLAFVNFGVYWRERFGPADTPQGCIAERVLLAPNAASSGIVSVAEAGAQHDNLFTAIYPIIFRTDLAAACFNYAFSGIPFANLVESVPTTKMILETYSLTPCHWDTEIGIVGNAVNSWKHYRVRWHGAIMPEVLALAAEVGVDRVKVADWTRVHWSLLLEARDLYPDIDFSSAVGAAAIDRSMRMFRKDILASLS